jgi:hypothetical protein
VNYTVWGGKKVHYEYEVNKSLTVAWQVLDTLMLQQGSVAVAILIHCIPPSLLMVIIFIFWLKMVLRETFFDTCQKLRSVPNRIFLSGMQYDPNTFSLHAKSWSRATDAVMHIFPYLYWGNLQFTIGDLFTENNTVLFSGGKTANYFRIWKVYWLYL